MPKKKNRRDFLKKGGAVTAGFTFGMFGGLKFNSKEGIRIGREKVKFGMAEASASCGSAYTCAGGGGECGSAYTCAGGGGECGSSYSCAGGQGSGNYGGSGTCGSSYSCAGGGGQCGSAYTCGGN